MTRSSLSLCKRILAPIQSASILLLLLILSGLGNYLPAAALQAAAQGPKIWLQDNQPLAVAHTGAAANPGLMAATQPVSLTSGDIDADGVADLVVGYRAPGGGVITVHRGNLDAFAPQSDASLQAIGRGEFPSPFLTDANTFSVPVSPDFIALGNFTGDGQRDLIIAARGSNTLYIFPGDGKGGFGAAQTVGVPGGVTSLAVGDFGPSAQFSTVLIGVGAGKNSSLIVLGGSAQGLNMTGALPLKGPASNFDFGNFGGGNDAAFLSGGQIFILRSSTLQLSQVSLPLTVRAFALGSFLFDRNGGAQIAALAADGSVSIVARSEFDPRTYTVEEFNSIRQARLLSQPVPLAPPTVFPANGWKVVETLASVGTIAPGQTPVFFRTRVSSSGGDDVMWLNAGNNRMAVISHSDVQPGAQTFAPGTVSIKPYSGAPINALPLRVNIDGRPGVVAIHQGESAPSVSMPIPDPTFFPNRFDDIAPRGTGVTCLNTTGVDASGDCTLREAIIKANATAGTDNITLQAGTYTLTRGRIAAPAYDAQTGTLNVNDSLNITGAVDGSGNPTSIITWGALTSGLSVDMVMAVNEDITILSNATASISNVIIQNGVNHGTHGNDGDGGCMEFDTGTSGAATLTLTNVILQNCSTTQGSGGGLASFNFVVATGTGQAIITNSTIQNNSVTDGATPGPNTSVGGGIWISDPSRATITNSKILNNLATQTVGGAGFGGGIEQTSKGTANETPQTVIHSSTISGNKSAFQGGGMRALGNLLIDQGTVISGNQNGQNGAGATNGGGLFLNPAIPSLTQTLSKVTITGNSSTGTGGGVATGAIGAGAVTISFSRFAGNTATNSGSNLENLGSTTTATNNWWGTNAASSTIHTTAGTTTFDPFIVLTHSATPHPIKVNQSSTLTGDMSNDNHGNGAALAGNLGQIVGLPITFNNPVLGSIPQAQPETLGNPVPTATATFNAGGTSGRGSADATVDQAVVGANSNLIASATEVSTTATITTVGKHNFSVGETVVIAGVGVAGYNGTFTIVSTPTPTTFTYSTSPTSGLGASSGGSANVGIIILEPLKITKSFVPATVATNTASTLTLSVNNPNVMPVDGNFTDTLPSGVGAVPGSMVVANPPGATNTCGGTFAPVAGAGSVTFSSGSGASAIPVGTCTITVHVSSTVDNIYHNSVTINSVAAGTNANSTSSADLNVINPPTIAKAFGAAKIPLNGTTSLTFTISSTNQNQTLGGVAFTDNLPVGLVVATPNGLTTTCTGTPTATAGSGSVSLSGASLAPGASCTLAVNVQGTTAGTKNNSVTVSDTTAGTGNTSNASITVVAPPTISKAFGAASIPLNGTTTLTFTISNPNNPATPAAGDLTGVAFSDTLPNTTGTLVVAAVPNVSNTCNGTVTATAGTGVISLSGATVAHNASCTLSVDVTGTAAGDANNTTGAITSTEGGTGATSNTATLKVVAPPSIAKAFSPTSIALNTTTSLTFTITNPAANTVALTGVAFTDTLPTGLTVASSSSTVCGGTLTTTNPTGISLTGATIAVGGTCQFSVTVTGATAGQYTNTTGAVSSTNGGTGNTATANLTVVAPPSVAKAFNPTSIPLNGTTTLTITITNPPVNTVALSPVTLNDILPTGLTVASAIVSDPCGLGSGILHTTAPTTIQIGGVTIPANGQCVVNVTVTGAAAGQYTNTTGSVSSGNGGTGNTASANLTVVGPPTISKAFGAASIPRNGTTTVTFTIGNPNTTAAGDLSGVAFSDTLPVSGGPGSATLVVSSTPNVSNTCGGTVTATAGTGVISLSGASVAHNASCTLSVDVKGTVEGDASNTTGAITSTQGGTGATSNTATLKVVAPPTISKAFGAAAISLNGTTTVTFTITNPASNTSAENGIAFSDTLTNGLQVASTPGVTNSCGGTVTAAANSTSISLTGGSIATPGATCTIVVNVTGTQSGTVTNTTGAVSSTNGGTGATSNTATLIVASPATVTKQFGATKIPLNGTTSLTINITNPNTNVTLNGLSFTDNLPAGLVIATPNALNNTCGGTATATAGSGSLSLSGGTVAASASCAVTVNVTGTTAGDKSNSVVVSSTEGGTSATATASLTVVAPPTIAKAFGAASIPLNGTTTLTFTIANPNLSVNGDLSGVAFSDTLPVSGGPGSATLVISSTPNVSNTCGGTVTATAGTGVISLSGASVAHNASCTLSVDVKGTVEGDASNTTGAITSTQGGTGTTSNTATLKVVAPPTISKAFGAASITLNGTTTVTFTITNPASNTSAENGIAFSDTLTNGLQVASTPGVTNNCGGTVTAAANSTSISLTGGSIATPGATCTIVVNVTGTQSGTVSNTTGAVSSTNGGTGATSNTATLTVASPATVTKQFGATKIPLNGTTSLTINITNPNTNVTLNGLSFTDNLPAGLVIATPNGLSNSCGGTATATAGSGSLSLSGGTLASSASCAVTVNVTGTTAGDKSNSVVVSSTEGGTSATATASITVVAPPTIAKAFGAASIPLNGTTTLTFTIANPNVSVNGDLSGVAFSDTLPSTTGTLVVATPNGLSNTCGGTVTATAGTGVISLSGGSVAHNASCTLSVNVTGTAAGAAANTTGAITSTEGGTGTSSNTATIAVVAPPSIAKVFNPSNIALNATTSLTFTITNPAANTVALAGVAFSDTLPTGLTVASATSSVCGGTLTTTNPTGISLSGATVAANGQCQFSVTVTGAAAGQFTNTTGNVSSTNGGTGNTASANLTVATPPTITKAFGAASILLNASTSMSFTINNPNTSLALTGVAFSDTLPAGLQISTPSGLTTTCSGTVTAAAGSGSVSLTGGTLAANASCTISVNVTGIAAGVQNNTTGPISSNESGAGATSNTASITVIGPPSIAKAFGAASINLNAQTTLSFTITNPNATVALTGVGFGDTLPAGLAVANPNGLTGSCGAGTITTGTVSGFSVVNLSGGTIAAGGSCTFSVNVVGVTGGHKVNTTGTVTSSNAGSGNQATASIDVLAPDPTITKTHSGTFTRGQTGAQWTITVSNVGFGPTVGTVTVVDTLPNVTNPPVPTAISGTGWTCTLATLTCTRADALASGSSYPPITLTVNIPINIVNNFTNTAKVSGGGDVNPNNNTATDSISLGPPIVVTPQNNASTVKAGSATQYTLNVEDDDPTLGMVSFGCSGLPAGTSCVFNPPATNQPLTVVTMTVTTSNGQTAVAGLNFDFGGKPPLYAALFFPVLGLVGIALSGSKARKTRLRFAMVFVGAAMLLSFAGCGGGLHGPVTPAGSYQLTVTAASTTVQASAPVTLNVQ